MIKVDESDPVGELEPSFPYKDITIRRGVDMKEHYELQSEIGRGKFGTVFKCREKATGLMLAAKFVGIVHKQDRRNVEREVEIMCELQHPRLIQLYDAFEANNAMCFILELVEGGELFERVIGDDFVLTEKAVTIFMRQICEGVQFIHSKNILHLDLKPENILCLTKTGNRIKIIDFGLARKFNPENKLQVLFGTPEFVAPEVVNFDAIGFGTDMWSVGVICYVLLSGLSPFMGETDVETMANVTIAQYDFDDEAFDSISNDAKDFIKKLLVKDHKSRMTATECLAHRWLQRKKPKKMVRKGSSKKLLLSKQQTAADSCTAETAVAADREPRTEDAAAVPLDATKENLIEFRTKSRSQSPVVITPVSPEQAPPAPVVAVPRRDETENDCAGPAGLQTVQTTASGRDGGGPQLQTASSTALNGTDAPAKTAPVDIVPPPGTDGGEGRRTTVWSQHLQTTLQQTTTNNGFCSSYRRSSDVSYMLSSFRATATMSSNLLGSDLRGLSERLQDLQLTMFEDHAAAAAAAGERGPPAEVSSNLHRLLLNRQQLTAAVADRKPKYKLSPMNRDVPVGSPPPASNLLYYMTAAASPSCRSAPHSKRASPEHDYSSSTKEMLLKLFYGADNNKPAEPNVSA
ncbi:Protein kinase domain,Protein kinase-like domain,Serine/threonine-protein kinase, active [Cinara cedri]|uniref:Protein kinase domain,Protein kinase-like domain,Serine/threonine-protein kinase, active n=1 Tax=Cinara cedri TaxID=506608 RepID=A0A5E4N3L6_9HEMI|nr:Protein kinase domain,Protein kinase-like domain,Serine/threonine-protein kinase, active [Cinara cedri]